MKKQAVLDKMNQKFDADIARIDWLFDRMKELGIEKVGDEFTMEDKAFKEGSKFVCLDIRDTLDDIDIMYGVKQLDSHVYTEMNYFSLYCHDHN